MRDEVTPHARHQAESVFASVCDFAELGLGERRRLAAMIAGTQSGNKDRSIYALCAAIQEAACDTDLGTLLDKQRTGLRPLFAAFLNYLATTGNADDLDMVERHCLRLGRDPSEAARKSAASELGALLYRHRRDAFATEVAWRRYKTLRDFLNAQGRSFPCDTDALSFWSEHLDPDAWGQIKTCVQGFIDLDLCLRERDVICALRHAAPLSTPGVAEADLEPVEEVTPLEDTLTAALDSFAQCPLKPFKGTEMEVLAIVFSLGHRAKSWPQSAECRLRYAPLQAILVQAQRDGTLDAVDRDSIASRLQSSACLRDALRSLSRHCADLLYLALTLHPDLCERVDSSPPGTEADRDKRLKGFRRRSAIQHLSDGTLARHLMALVPALVATRDHLGAALDRLEGLEPKIISQNEDHFLSAVLRRYGVERTGQDG